MKNIIWLSPSLAAGAIAARLMVFFKRRPQGSPSRAVELPARSCPAGFQTRTRVQDREPRDESRRAATGALMSCAAYFLPGAFPILRPPSSGPTRTASQPPCRSGVCIRRLGL